MEKVAPRELFHPPSPTFGFCPGGLSMRLYISRYEFPLFGAAARSSVSFYFLFCFLSLKGA